MSDNPVSPLMQYPPRPVSIWTPERDALLAEMVAEGVPYSRIGEHLGVSRSAAIGRAYRLDLPPRLARAEAEVVETVWPDHAHCCWPLGDPGRPEFRFCGEAAARQPYCEAHRAVAFVPPPPPRSKAA